MGELLAITAKMLLLAAGGVLLVTADVVTTSLVGIGCILVAIAWELIALRMDLRHR